MIFRKGTTVQAQDGEFGTLADVVVDALTHQVTHLVVDPGGDHQQARLVPVWLVVESGSGLQIQLPANHVRQLQRALESDFVRVSSRVVDDGDETRRFRTVLTVPFFEDPSITRAYGESFVGLPRDACEIRRSSWVVGSAERVLGTVAGFLIDGDLVHSVIVRSGLIGHRHNVAVPVGMIDAVSSHMVMLRIDRDEFRTLPLTTVMPHVRFDFDPKKAWHGVLGHPTNKLWDDFEVDGHELEVVSAEAADSGDETPS